MKSMWVIFLIINLGLIQARTSLSDPDLCITPNNDLGRCMEIRECSIFIDVIRSQKHESCDFLRASQCELEGEGEQQKYPKVCCGKYANYVNNNQSSTTKTLQQSKDPFPKDCGYDASSLTSTDLIVGGIEAKLGQFPWMARLSHLRSDGLFSYGCIGFLISEKFVLTAAHCINSSSLAALEPIYAYQVQLGEHNTETDPDCDDGMCADPPQYLKTAHPIIHPDYVNNIHQHNDIAVIPLKEPAKLNNYVQAICLSDTPLNHSKFTVSGWGKTESSRNSAVKLAVRLDKADWNNCSKLYKTRGVQIVDSQICVGGQRGRYSCSGDSGGPLMTVKNGGIVWYAEGIVSLGKGCGEAGWPGVYTYLPKYMPWIRSAVNQYLKEEEEEKKGLGLIQAQQFSNSERAATCVTPNNDIGVCVDIVQCSIFVDVIRNQKRENYDFLRASQCESQIRKPHPKVCCGIYDNYINQQTTAKTVKNLVIPTTGLFPKNCGEDPTTVGKIFGGEHAELGQFPWMARLRHLRKDGLFSYGCVGFLISEKFVLTAAHCILSQALAPLGPIYQVQLGEHNLVTDPDCEKLREFTVCADPPQYLRNSEPIVHPDYSNDSNYYNDIAIIPLIKPAKLTKYVQPICLSRTSSNIYDYFWVSGWGKTENSSHSTVKLNVLVPKADWNQCSDLYRTRGIKLFSNHVCAGGEKGEDTCTGDSGGPLMAEKDDLWYAEGIVSFGKGCGEKGWPGIYTYVPNYMPWIELMMTQYLKEHSEEVQEEIQVPVVDKKTENHVVWNK